KSNGLLFGIADRAYDAAGNLKTYSEASGSTLTNSSYSYTPDGKVRQQISSTGGTTNYVYDDSGTLLKTVNMQGATTLTTFYSYEYWDTPKESKIQIQAANALAPNWQPGFSNFIYDINGHLTQVNDVVGNRSLHYTVDGRGLVLQRNELDGTASSKTQNYYYLNGIGVGDSGFTLSRTDYASVLASRGMDPKTAKPISSADFGS